jgi:DNA-directed RNA polymerase specialized sigma24 family protein
MSAQVAEYRGLCEALAARMVRPGRMSRTGVEYDDLVQEGLIFVWKTLQRGEIPSTEHVRNTMLMYIRKMGQEKRGGKVEFVPYEEEQHDDEERG